MTTAKRQVSVCLDADLVDQLEASEETLSSQIDNAIRNELVRRRRQRLLGEMLEELNELHGPVDEDLADHYSRLLH